MLVGMDRISATRLENFHYFGKIFKAFGNYGIFYYLANFWTTLASLVCPWVHENGQMLKNNLSHLVTLHRLEMLSNYYHFSIIFQPCARRGSLKSQHRYTSVSSLQPGPNPIAEFLTWIYFVIATFENWNWLKMFNGQSDYLIVWNVPRPWIRYTFYLTIFDNPKSRRSKKIAYNNFDNFWAIQGLKFLSKKPFFQSYN